MDAILKLNGQVINPGEFTVGILADIMTTANPGAKTSFDAITAAGGLAYVESKFLAGKNPDDVFEVTVTGKSAGKTVTTVATGTRAKIAKRFELALSRDSWQCEIVRVTDGKKDADESTDSPAVMADI